MKIFSQRLSELMNENHTSYSELSKLCNTTRQAVSCYVTGKNVPRLDKLVELAKHYSVSTDYLLGLSDVRTTEIEVKAICEYTGLTESTILKIHEMNAENKATLERVIGVL